MAVERDHLLRVGDTGERRERALRDAFRRGFGAKRRQPGIEAGRVVATGRCERRERECAGERDSGENGNGATCRILRLPRLARSQTRSWRQKRGGTRGAFNSASARAGGRHRPCRAGKSLSLADGAPARPTRREASSAPTHRRRIRFRNSRRTNGKRLVLARPDLGRNGVCTIPRCWRIRVDIEDDAPKREEPVLHHRADLESGGTRLCHNIEIIRF